MTARDWGFVAILFVYALAFAAACRMVWLAWSWKRTLERRARGTTTSITVEPWTRFPLGSEIRIGEHWYRVVRQEDSTVTVERVS